MDTLTIIKIIFGIFASVTSAGAIIWWFVQLTANTLAEHYKKKIEHDFEMKLEGYKSQLDILKATTLKYNDRQFELYIDLWKNLQNLKFTCIDLWNKATRANLRKFQTSLINTHRQVETTSILIEEDHYKEIIEVISNLQEFDNGKEKLITKLNTAEEWEINELIFYNRERKDKCLEIIDKMKIDIRTRIRGQ
jgi:hypothetical protein